MKLEVNAPVVVIPPKTYTLTLNQPEIDVLSVVLRSIGGYDGPQGYREVMNRMESGIRPYAVDKGILHGNHFPDTVRIAPTE